MVSFSGWKLSTLEYTYAWRHDFDFPTNMCSLAAHFGNVEVLKYLRKLGLEWDVSTTAEAARYNRLAFLVYARTNNCPWDETTCSAAALAGHLECLRYLHRHGCELEYAPNGNIVLTRLSFCWQCLYVASSSFAVYLRPKSTSCKANDSSVHSRRLISGPHFHRQLTVYKMVFSLVKLAYFECSVEQRLWYNSIPGPVVPVDVRSCCEYLIKARKVARLLTNCEQPDVCLMAAENGHVDCLRLAHVAGMPWNSHTMAAAGRAGHIECLSYAHQNGCEWDETTCSAAAENGSIECLKYALRNGCPRSADTCTEAALHGHLNCLMYASQHGCPWDEQTCAAAALAGHLECLRYLHRNGCPWDARTCQAAAINGHYRSLKYAHRHGCELEVNTLFLALINVKMKCYNYALRNISPLPSSVALWRGNI
ncbi:uncharacterized protein LOC113557814 [Rhopalosiphum maidis]|uniref:uncharacterized protein LOC113557814 n=1 Tax=Rhopalosiphum maidis TaxID=43146 RepID=UPI000EFE8C96|nr:uncharacterized protein LOC113557814 [Rhopalosiphum maidis]